ncbi:MAG: Gfo/Idh/MocA family oxidoreductase [Candidatus Kaiserbacteria bacterium]|nr:Gfo/Idh/MocA family oxidoreductase [Candidatus Kaiserbacteria bacterium]
MSDTYTVGIVGAGRMGSTFDAPGSPRVLTHAHAFSRNPRTRLIGIADLDVAKADHEARKWDTNAYGDFARLLTAKPDIVVIATPDTEHTRMIKEAASVAKLIICEKPAAVNNAEAEALKEYEGAPVVVNYRRRFDETMIALAREIAAGTYGTVISASAIYSKGLLHSGSHMIDLARMLFGEITSAKALATINDWEGDDTIAGFAAFERCPQFYLETGDERAYSIFEIDVRLEKRRIRLTDEGIRMSVQEIVPDPVYDGFVVLGAEAVTETKLLSAMENLAQHSVDFLDGKTPLRSSLAEALKTYEACMRFRFE